MRRIKSAPANICNMVNRKVSKTEKNNIVPLVPFVPVVPVVPIETLSDKKKKVLQKKQLTNTITGIISDAFSETNKYIPQTDNYYYQFIIECINNFLTNKLTRKNFENLIYSLIIRIIVSDIYHEVIIKVKENMHIIK